MRSRYKIAEFDNDIDKFLDLSHENENRKYLLQGNFLLKKKKSRKEYIVDIVQALAAFFAQFMLVLPLIAYFAIKVNLNEVYTPYPY